MRGGRASLKSWSTARSLILHAVQRKERILCTREHQRSLKDSVLRLLTDQLDMMGIGCTTTREGVKLPNGSEFMCAYGLRHNIRDIKSMEGITKVWAEEAEAVSSESWRTLIPTIRVPGSEIWATYNLDKEDDPTNQRFAINTPPNTIFIESSWRYADSIGLFSEESRQEMEYMRETDHDAFMNIWEGHPRQRTEAEVLGGKYVVDNFDLGDWSGPYFGADWGFSKDPTCLIKFWIDEDARILYIEHEAYAVGCEIDQTSDLFDQVPGSRDYKIRADNARPETISYLKNRGFDITAAPKWAGSIEDGVTWLRSFRQIVIHDRCKNMIFEARNYKHKVDRLTEDILPDIVDANNHGWDAIRYGASPMIRNKPMDINLDLVHTGPMLESASPPWMD